jgi:hypothetical protein
MSVELSKNLMAMRFMKRAEEADRRMKLEEEQQQLLKESHWVRQVADIEYVLLDYIFD